MNITSLDISIEAFPQNSELSVLDFLRISRNVSILLVVVLIVVIES